MLDDGGVVVMIWQNPGLNVHYSLPRLNDCWGLVNQLHYDSTLWQQSQVFILVESGRLDIAKLFTLQNIKHFINSLVYWEAPLYPWLSLSLKIRGWILCIQSRSGRDVMPMKVHSHLMLGIRVLSYLTSC
jgi:hypothetical protein